MSARALTLHVVTDAFPPTPTERHLHGGLEAWTCNLVDQASDAGIKVVVYVCGFSCGIADTSEYPYDVVDIAGQRAPAERPLLEGASSLQRIASETQRLNFLLLRNAIRDRVAAQPAGRHCILSNYVLGPGYLAMLVADDLDIQHVAVVVGTDFSRGCHNRFERHLFEEVCQRADLVVCKSAEQAHGIAMLTPPPAVRIIPNGVTAPLRPRDHAPSRSPIRLFSDCGLSFHKGSAVLLDSFLSLRAEGLPLTLTLCGSISEHEQDYWNPLLADTQRRAKGSFEHLGHVERRIIDQQLLEADVYCSASLGEGCSGARIRALCSGIPLVTTDCGEFAHEVQPLSHVRVAAAGDAPGYRARLSDLCATIVDGRLEIDWKAVERHRRSFSREREAAQWRELLETIIGTGRQVD